MRVLQSEWTVHLNQRERERHRGTFRLDADMPPVFIRRIAGTDRYVVESTSTVSGLPVRLTKGGAWQPFDPDAPPRTAHVFAETETARKAIERGERANDDRESRVVTTSEMEHGAAA